MLAVKKLGLETTVAEFADWDGLMTVGRLQNRGQPPMLSQTMPLITNLSSLPLGWRSAEGIPN